MTPRDRRRSEAAGSPGLPPLVPLALIVGISPLATDMYIPSLPSIAADLGTSSTIVQLSLTAFLVAFALGQILIGPLSDAIGRRPMLIAGTAAFVAASVLCALAGDPAILIVGRVVQGIAGAGASVAARALVTDAAPPDERPRVLALIGAVTSIGPVVAPLVGGVVVTFVSWRWVFGLLAALGVVMLAFVLARFPETLPHDARSPGVGLGATLRRMWTLLRIPAFSAYVAASCFATVGFFAYIATSSFVFQTQYGFSETLYTIVFAVNASCMVLTTLLFRSLVRRMREERLMLVGLVVATVGSAALLAAAVLDAGAVWTWGCLIAVTGAWGFVVTGGVTITQRIGAALPGTAAALQGGLAFGLGGLGTPLASLLGGTAVAMGTIMAAGIGVGLLVVLMLAVRSRGRRGPSDH